jgi:hypothetical protein
MKELNTESSSENAVSNVQDSPVQQAARSSPRNGVVPPPEHRWKPGQSGNPAGRPKAAGSSIREWLNIMTDWSTRELQAVLDDPEAPSAKATAARMWKHARSDERTKSGLPIAGPEAERICDQTAGKPRQAIELSRPVEVLNDLPDWATGQRIDARSTH